MLGRLLDPELGNDKTPHTRVDSEDDLGRFYTLSGNILGKGAFGTVIEAFGEDQKLVAIKKVDKAKAGNAEVILLEREVQILKTIGHAYIIELLHVLETSSTMYLVQEKCDTHLGNYLNQQDDKKLPETQCQNIIRQAADALYYLHKKGIIHRDLKCENILVVRSPQSQFDIEIRITDFGLAVISGQEFQESTCGTPLYMAPEILLRHSYSLQCDIWSLGIISYRIMTGCFPFPNSVTEGDLIERIKVANFDYTSSKFVSYSQKAIDLVQNMLKVDPATRIAAGEISKSAWVQGREDKDMPNVIDLMREFHAQESDED